jgi:hypothetical protein
MPNARRITHLPRGQTHARGTDDEVICGLASRQHGLVARGQLVALGIGDRAISHRLRTGRLLLQYPGVYAAGHEAISYAGRALAAVMATAPGSAASHVTALALWGLREPPTGIHVTATRRRAPRRGVTIQRSALPGDEVALADGVPTTSVPRTLLDLSSMTGERRLRRLIKQAEFAGLITIEELGAILARHPRRRGRRTLARIVAGHSADAGPTRSALEDRFLDFCARRGLPRPAVNAVRTAAGFSPMRITWGQLHSDGDSIEAEIRDALSARTSPPQPL